MTDERSSLADTMMMIGAGVVGAAIGAAVALLLAPKAGSELREELKKTAAVAGERLTEASQTVAEKVKVKAQEVGQKVQEAAQSAKEKAEHAPEEVQPEGV